MTATYTLAPNPIWYIADKYGRPLGANPFANKRIPLGGGYLVTLSSLNPQNIKLVYTDQAGQYPWSYVTVPNVGSQGVLFDENGSQGPFYWEFDPDVPDDTYYLEVYDSNGVLQWTVNNFFPSGGGGGVITEAVDLKNLIINGIMWRNQFIPSPVPNFVKIAPSANAGFVGNTTSTPIWAGEDIVFLKSGGFATDSIEFNQFITGDQVFAPDVTPYEYLEYISNSTSGETFKLLQFPINSKVQTLSSQEVTVTIWAMVNSGANTLTLQWRQFYGDGGGSPDQIITIGTCTLNNEWQKFSFVTTTPDAIGQTLGACGNDALFLQVLFPVDVACDISLTKASMYLGSIIPNQEFILYDEIDAQMNTARTGDTRISANSFIPGWIAMNDGTIGSVTSNASSRANIDTFPLYNLMWNSISNMWCPVTGGRGANASSDFAANKPMQLIRALGRVFAGTINLPVITTFTYNFTTGVLTTSGTQGFFTGVPVLLSNTGGALPAGLFAGGPSGVYYAIQNIDGLTLKLASSPENAIANIAIPNATNNGTGIQSIQVPQNLLGSFTGSATHTNTIQEMAHHVHGYAAAAGSGSGATSGLGLGAAVITSDAEFNSQYAGQQPYFIAQPTTLLNMFIKL
jgi:hypothetical protein